MSVTEVSHVPGESEYLGDFVVRDELGVDFQEVGGLSYLDSPIHVFRTPNDDGDHFEAYIDHLPMEGLQFFQFLRTMTPHEEYVTPDGICNDWNVVDRVHDNNQQFRQRLEDLVTLHEFLGQPWREFLASQPAFLATMHDAIVPHFHADANISLRRIPKNPDIQSTDFIQSGINSVDDTMQLLKDAGIDIEPHLYGALAKKRGLGLGKRNKITDSPETRPELKKYFESWGEDRRRRFLKGVFERLSSDAKSEIIEDVYRFFYDTVTLDDGHDYSYLKTALAEGQTLRDAYDQRRTVRKGNYLADYLDIRLAKDGKAHRAFVHGSPRTIDPRHTIAPLLSWTRNSSGSRAFVIDRMEDNDAQGETLHRYFRDGVLGVLAVAYYSPEVRRDWPQHQRIRDSRTQEMGPAQLPVLALMLKDDLLKSDFIEAAESVA